MSLQLAVLSEWHLILLLVIVFLLFGGKKLPELAKGIGQAMKEFKKASREADDAIRGVDTTPSNNDVSSSQQPGNGSKSS